MNKIVKLRKDMLTDDEIQFFDTFVKQFGMPPEFALAHIYKYFVTAVCENFPAETGKSVKDCIVK